MKEKNNKIEAKEKTTITEHVKKGVSDLKINRLLEKQKKKERAELRKSRESSPAHLNEKKRKKFYSQKGWVKKYESLIEDPATILTNTASSSEAGMINFYFDPLKVMSEYVHTSFATGIPTGKARLLNSLYLQHVEGLHPGIPVAMGKRCIDMVLNRSRELKRDFIYIDHAYFFRGYSVHPGRSDIYFRVIINDVHAKVDENLPLDRFKGFRLKMKPWRSNGDHILICPPTGYLEDMVGLSKNWLNETLHTIRQNSDRPIVIRQKPGLTKVDHLMKAAKNFDGVSVITGTKKRPLRFDLKNCWATVAPASGVSIESALLGIPTFCEPISPVSSISVTDYSKIESPIFKDREPVMASLAYSQFNVTEMANGYAFMILKQRYPRIFRNI